MPRQARQNAVRNRNGRFASTWQDLYLTKAHSLSQLGWPQDQGIQRRRV